ncbi:Transposase [Bifidobacterium longum subsp. longum]|nr:Transposase [Bifidobacterium longum subsp. longum]
MISMPQIQSIRSRRRNGESIASIARSERVSEPTVRKYLRVNDLSARPPVRRRRGSVIDEWLPMIEGMLAEDRETWRKQRHTATRIHERLRDEYGAGVSLSTVTRTVCVCSIESGPCERVDVFHVSGRFWSTSACGEKRTPARPAWTSFPS